MYNYPDVIRKHYCDHICFLDIKSSWSSSNDTCNNSLYCPASYKMQKLEIVSFEGNDRQLLSQLFSIRCRILTCVCIRYFLILIVIEHFHENLRKYTSLENFKSLKFFFRCDAISRTLYFWALMSVVSSSEKHARRWSTSSEAGPVVTWKLYMKASSII